MKIIQCLAAIATTFIASVAVAQSYPNKPIKIVVPYPAGGNADITGRVLAKKMSDILNVAVVVENRGGANGGIGTDVVVKAAPDGYTLLLAASGPIVINPVLYAKVPYDPIKDLRPISQVLTFQYVLVVPTASSIKSIQDIVTQARNQPGKLSYGSTGIGGGGHLAGEMFAMLSNTQFNHAPYKGSAPALVDLLGGQLTFTFDTVLTASPLIKDNRLRAFAVSGPKRASSLPDVPTMAEAGFPGFEETAPWIGMFAPAKTPPALVSKINEALLSALAKPEIRSRIENLGAIVMGNSPADFAIYLKRDFSRWEEVIKAAGVTAD